MPTLVYILVAAQLALCHGAKVISPDLKPSTDVHVNTLGPDRIADLVRKHADAAKWRKVILDTFYDELSPSQQEVLSQQFGIGSPWVYKAVRGEFQDVDKLRCLAKFLDYSPESPDAIFHNLLLVAREDQTNIRPGYMPGIGFAFKLEDYYLENVFRRVKSDCSRGNVSGAEDLWAFMQDWLPANVDVYGFAGNIGMAKSSMELVFVNHGKYPPAKVRNVLQESQFEGEEHTVIVKGPGNSKGESWKGLDTNAVYGKLLYDAPVDARSRPNDHVPVTVFLKHPDHPDRGLILFMYWTFRSEDESLGQLGAWVAHSNTILEQPFEIWARIKAPQCHPLQADSWIGPDGREEGMVKDSWPQVHFWWQAQ